MEFLRTVNIGGREVGEDRPPFLVAEIGLNHNGDVGLAREMVRAAASVGADAVKFQTFVAERLVVADAAVFGVATAGLPRRQVDLYKSYELSWSAYREVAEVAREAGVFFFSTPFDEESADRLDALGVPAFKIASGDMTHLALIRHVAAKGKPVLLSTGMCTLGEVEEAVRAVYEAGNRQLVLLHCTSSYPCPDASVNLAALETLRQAFGVPVGLSDHTEDNLASFAAVALGAAVIEKHFTLDKNLTGVDQKMSADPGQLAVLANGIRRLVAMRGRSVKMPDPAEFAARHAARRSIVAATRIPRGTAISRGMLAVKRPGTGLPPSCLDWVVGRSARVDIEPDTVLTAEML